VPLPCSLAQRGRLTRERRPVITHGPDHRLQYAIETYNRCVGVPIPDVEVLRQSHPIEQPSMLVQQRDLTVTGADRRVIPVDDDRSFSIDEHVPHVHVTMHERRRRASDRLFQHLDYPVQPRERTLYLTTERRQPRQGPLDRGPHLRDRIAGMKHDCVRPDRFRQPIRKCHRVESPECLADMPPHLTGHHPRFDRIADRLPRDELVEFRAPVRREDSRHRQVERCQECRPLLTNDRSLPADAEDGPAPILRGDDEDLALEATSTQRLHTHRRRKSSLRQQALQHTSRFGSGRHHDVAPVSVPRSRWCGFLSRSTRMKGSRTSSEARIA